MAKPRGGRDNSHRSAYQANLDRKHETRMAILRWMTENDEAPYILCFLVGSGFTAFTNLVGASINADGEVTSDGEPTGFEIPWVFEEGKLLSIHDQMSKLFNDDGSPTSSYQDSIAGMLSYSMAGMGTSLQAFGLGMLLYKNSGPVLQGIGEMIPG